jgi:hypothetical protein
MLNLKSWERVVHEDTGVSFEVKRLRQGESMDLIIMLSEGALEVGDVVKNDGMSETEFAQRQAVALRRAYSRMDQGTVEALLTKYVRNVEGLTIDDEPITTGAGLYQWADLSLLMLALGSLRRFSSLTEKEGKGSSSPSTSAVDQAGRSSDSPVLRIEPADGQASSTATETVDEIESSSAVA